MMCEWASGRGMGVAVLIVVSAGAMPRDNSLAAAEAHRPRFAATVDPAVQAKFGLQYPATYVFRVGGVTTPWSVRWRKQADSSWKVLAQNTTADFFNGAECVRLDAAAGRAYVSLGFHGTPRLEIEFTGVGNAAFDSMARYYDGRQAAYTLSNDNWGCNAWGHPGAPWRGSTDDASDCYQAAVHVCRSFHLPLSVAINSRSAGGDAVWKNMQDELDRGDASWEPAVHGWTHPKDREAYLVHGYKEESLGCREDILKHLRGIPYGQYVYEHILTHGYVDDTILATDDGEFLFVRGFNWLDNPTSSGFVPWHGKHRFYGVGGLNTMGYDRILETREPKGRFSAADVKDLNDGFDRVRQAGGIFYALWHPDRFQNSVLYDPRPGIDGVQGSTLMQHLAHVANRRDVWYVANGWLYSYRYVAEHARVAALP